MREIRRWDTNAVIYDHGREAPDREVVEAAVSAGMDLYRADLADADLTHANLAHADIDGTGLAGANLDGANLDGANLDGAKLDGAKLDGANLDPIRDDIYEILSHAPAEVPALLAALRAGKIDGSAYSGECACLVGTIANARGCTADEIPGIVPNGSRLAERWFLAIRPGTTPENHSIARITEKWIEQWLSEHPAPAVAS